MKRVLLAGALNSSTARVAIDPIAEALEGRCVWSIRRQSGIRGVISALRWSEAVILIRGFTWKDLLITTLSRLLMRPTLLYWDDNPFLVPSFSSSYSSLRSSQGLFRTKCLMREANLIGVASPRLGAWLHRAFNAPVHALTVPTAVEPRSASPSRERLSFGFAGSHDHGPSVQKILTPVLELLKQKGIPFHCDIVGPLSKFPAHLQSHLRFIKHMAFGEWSVTKRSLDWNFALAPLPYSRFFSHKFANKFIDFASVGVPCIFSRVPPYLDFVKDGFDGILVDNDAHQWVKAMLSLYDDPIRADSITNAGLDSMRTRHSLTAAVAQWQNSVDSLLTSRRPRLSKGLLLGVIGICAALLHRLFTLAKKGDAP